MLIGHFILLLTYAYAYVTYSWIMKSTTWDAFVYFCMDLETARALAWYPALAAVHFLVYGFFAAVSSLSRQRCLFRQRVAPRSRSHKSCSPTKVMPPADQPYETSSAV